VVKNINYSMSESYQQKNTLNGNSTAEGVLGKALKSLLFYLLAVPVYLQAQSYDCIGGSFAKVLAPSGLSLRAKPGRESPRIALIPDQTILWLCDMDRHATYETIEGHYGTWIRAYHGQVEGYIFSGFLRMDISAGFEIEVPIELVYVYLDTSLQWGVYPTPDKNKFKVARLAYKDTILNVQEKGQRLQTKALVVTSKATPILLFEGKKWQPTRRSFDGYFFRNQDLKPGESCKIVTQKGQFTLVSTKASSGSPSDGQVQKTTLVLRHQSEQTQAIQEQVIVQIKPIPPYVPSELRYNVVFFGDVDGDERPDLLVRYWYHHEMHEMRLFLSKPAEKGFLLKKVWTRRYS